MKNYLKYVIPVVFLIVTMMIVWMLIYEKEKITASVYKSCRAACENGGFGTEFCKEYCAPFLQFPDTEEEISIS